MNSIHTVVAPIRKATMSVNEVIVIAEPARPNVSPILSASDLLNIKSSMCICFQYALNTKISSTPRPKSKNGKDVCIGPYGMPIKEHIPTASKNALPTQKSPIPVRKNCVKDETIPINHQIKRKFVLYSYNNYIRTHTRNSTQLYFESIAKTYRNINATPKINLSIS